MCKAGSVLQLLRPAGPDLGGLGLRQAVRIGNSESATTNVGRMEEISLFGSYERRLPIQGKRQLIHKNIVSDFDPVQLSKTFRAN